MPLDLVETAQPPDTFSTLAFDSLVANVPGYDPTEGKIEARLIEATALMASELSVLIGAVPSAIFRYFGNSILELQSIDATFATVTGTVTMKDTLGYTMPAGTAFGLRATGDVLHPFVSISDLTVPPGTAIGTVAFQAVDLGAQGSGLSGTMESVDAVAYVTSVVTTGISTGGVDAESDLDYQDRLRDELTTLADRLILPRDAEVFSRRIAGVDRALCIDLLDPDLGTTNNARTMTVYLRDVAGEPVSTLTKLAVTADLAAKREVNFVVFVRDATYSTVSVAWSAVTQAGFSTADVVAAGNAALALYLNPAEWGGPAQGRIKEWTNVTKVRYLELAAVLDRVEGLNYITSLGFGISRAVTAAAATDLFTATAHGFTAGQSVAFGPLTGGAGIVANVVYYARDITANTFKVSATNGGVAIDITSDLTTGTVAGLSTADVTLPGFAPLPRAGSVVGAAVNP